VEGFRPREHRDRDRFGAIRRSPRAFVVFRHYNRKIKRDTRDASLYAIGESASPSQLRSATRLIADREVSSWQIFPSPAGCHVLTWSSGMTKQTHATRAGLLSGPVAIAQPLKLDELMPEAAAVVGGRVLLFGWEPRPKDRPQRLRAFRIDDRFTRTDT
jgi:hypothetical protein